MNEHVKLALCVMAAIPSICTPVRADTVEEQLQRRAEEARRSLPTMVTDGLQATNIATMGRTLILQYHFTTTTPFADMPRVKAEYFRSSVNSACTNPETINALKQGVTFSYMYHYFDNRFAMQYDINRRTCGR